MLDELSCHTWYHRLRLFTLDTFCDCACPVTTSDLYEGMFFYCWQVLDVRKRQLDDKMEENKRRQQESIQSREELLRELEEVQRMTARDKAEEERKRREREEEIQAQVRITGTPNCLGGIPVQEASLASEVRVLYLSRLQRIYLQKR